MSVGMQMAKQLVCKTSPARVNIIGSNPIRHTKILQNQNNRGTLMIKPTPGNCVLRPFKKEKSDGGIIIPDSVRTHDSHEMAEVIATSPSDIGEITTGQIVIFKSFNGIVVELKKEKYIVVPTKDILGIVT
jgi:co-chaperonin GroES (HSP10)